MQVSVKDSELESSAYAYKDAAVVIVKNYSENSWKKTYCASTPYKRKEIINTMKSSLWGIMKLIELINFVSPQ